MKLGMTGTRNGLNEFRIKQIYKFLSENDVDEAHHGDCVGADAQFHKAVQDMRVKTVIHPPNISTKREYCIGDIILKPKPYLDRNKDIVNDTDFLIAFPDTENEIKRSGTWSTIRYARNNGKPVLVILPSGEYLKINH